MAINIWHDVSSERRREEREGYLNQVTDALSKSLDYESTLDTLVNLLVPGLCDWCAIHMLEGGELRSVAVAHADPRKKQQAQQHPAKYPPNSAEREGLREVIRTGEPLCHRAVPEAELRASAVDDEHYQRLLETSMRSVILAPIKVREQVSGTLSLIASESGRRYDAQDMEFVSELGRRVGAFIDNALLYERAHVAAASAKAAAREAEAAGRLKDEFLATVSHELRTPLNAILGWATLLKTRSDAASIDKGIDVIFRNARAQSKLIEDILDVSRIITGKLRLELSAVDLQLIVADALEVVRPSAVAQGITIEVQAPSEPVLLAGDAQRLQQVLWNLLSNAVKFNVPNGRIVVRLEQHGTQVKLAVSDNGKGIDLEFLPYVFERFKQADGSTTRRYGGLGLGLAIVRHIVELHGGSVSVHSEGPGHGTTFSLSLPVRASLPAPEQQGEEPSASSGSGEHRVQTSLPGIRVLVVDDERDARELLDVVLSQAGAEVVMAGSVNDGLAALASFDAQVVVSDIGMPEQDGYSLIGRLNALYPPGQAIPAIALTAYTRSEDKLRALSLGFAAHVGKPVDPSDLIECIARLVPRG
jgi:signal transduction histidine kinase/CheY-like chemotaxis protein